MTFAIAVSSAQAQVAGPEQTDTEPGLAEGAAGTPVDAAQLELLKRRLEALERENAEYEDATRSITREYEQLKQRIDQLEATRAAQEDATRAVIRNALSTIGPKINEAVTLGGTLEVQAGSAQVFEGQSLRVLRLSTAQLDFGIQVNPWTVGNVSLAHTDGTTTVFPTTVGTEASVDRINVDLAYFTVGDPQRFPPFVTVGRQIVPFGVSTGNPTADVPTLENPLTVEVFETKEDAVLFGIGFPTPDLMPPPPPVATPLVEPQVVNPLISAASRGLGYSPPPTPPPPPTFTTPTPPPPPFNGSVYVYNGNTRRAGVRRDSRPSENFGATLGYRSKGTCGRSYQELAADDGSWWQSLCPWSIDIDIDYNNSVFDSLFLESEYQVFLNQIRYVDGMGASVKGSFGPLGYVAEWNGAINDARFFDELGRSVNIRPEAWQLSFTYQFDWNPWVERIGAQGTYVSLGYSETRDLAGVTRIIGGVNTRVGSAPRNRFLFSVGEWVADGLRIALEFSRVEDYPVNQGGTGRSADGVFTMLTYEW